MENTGRGLARWTDIVENSIQTASDVRLEDIENAFAHITEEADKGLYGLCNYYMAYYDMKNGKTDECLEYLKESIRCMVGTDQERNISRCYNMLGVIAHGQNNLLMASEHYNKALAYAARYEDGLVRNIVINNMADMYYRVGAYEKAFQCYRESMVEYERSGDDTASGMGNYMMGLSSYGYCLAMSNRMKDAKKVARRLADMQDGRYREQFPSLYAFTFFALLCHKLGRKEEAVCALDRAVESVANKRQLAGDFDGLLNLLELLALSEQYDYLTKVLDITEALAEEEKNDGMMLQLLTYRLKYCGRKLTDQEYVNCAEKFFRISEAHGDSESGLVIHMMEMSRRLWRIEEEQQELEQENLYQLPLFTLGNNIFINTDHVKVPDGVVFGNPWYLHDMDLANWEIIG